MPANPWIASLAGAFIDNALSALGAGVRALENPGEFLRDDLPPGTDQVTLWIQDRNRRACRRHARNEAAGLYSNLGALRRPRYNHCRPYLDSINEGATGGDYGPPWSGAGGQCSGKKYASKISVQTGSYSAIDGSLILGQVINSDVPCSFSPLIGPVILSSGTTSQGSKFWRFEGANNTSGASVFASSDYAALISSELTLCPNQGTEEGCPPPPNDYRPPTYPPNLPPLPPPEVAPPGGDGNDDIEIDPDGNWRICENGDCTPWFAPGGGGTPGNPGGDPDGDPQETDPEDPDNPNEISGCVGDGNVLVGLKINVLEHPITYDGSSDIYYRVGWIWIGPNEDQLDLTVDGATIRDGQFVFPDGPDCSCYTVRANPGFRLSVQAFSRPREENNNN